MSASVHGEGGRPGLRTVLAVVLFMDVLGVLDNFFLAPAPDTRLLWTPEWIVTIADMGWPIVALVALALGGILGFVRGKRAQLWFGLLVLVCMAVLVESMGAHVGDHRRRFYSTGATLTGWLLGLAIGWARGADEERSERLAEAGAAAGLVVTYANAGIQKLISGGLFEAHTFQAHIFTHHHIDDTSIVGIFARFVALHPKLAVAIALSVVVMQCGSWIFLVSRRGRMIWGGVLIAFHLGTLVFLHIIYIQATILLFCWAFPWGWVRDRVRGGASVGPPPEAPEAAPLPRALMATCAGAGALFVVVAWQLPTPRELAVRPMRISIPDFVNISPEPVDSSEPVDSPEPVFHVGPFAPGDELAGWSIVALDVDPGRELLKFELVRGGNRVRLSASGPQGQAPRGPLSRGELHILHTTRAKLSPAALEAVVEVMVERLAAGGEAPGEALDRSIAETLAP